METNNSVNHDTIIDWIKTNYMIGAEIQQITFDMPEIRISYEERRSETKNGIYATEYSEPDGQYEYFEFHLSGHKMDCYRDWIDLAYAVFAIQRFWFQKEIRRNYRKDKKYTHIYVTDEDIQGWMSYKCAFLYFIDKEDNKDYRFKTQPSIIDMHAFTLMLTEILFNFTIDDISIDGYPFIIKNEIISRIPELNERYRDKLIELKKKYSTDTFKDWLKTRNVVLSE